MRRNFITTSVIAIALTCLGTATPLAHATDIKIDYPNSPIPLGRTVVYSLINTPPGRGIIIYTWTCKLVFDNCEDEWGPFGTPNSPTTDAYENMPGTQDVRCDIVWGPPSGGSGNLTQRAELTIVAAPPETASIAFGDNTTTDLNSYCETRYDVKSQGSGFNLSGLAQEFVYDAVQYTQHLDPTAPDSTLNIWIPVSSDAPDYPKFQIYGNQI